MEFSGTVYYLITLLLDLVVSQQADTIRRETRFVRSLQLSTKVKVPLPHMLAVVVKDQANQLQMLTQVSLAQATVTLMCVDISFRLTFTLQLYKDLLALQ